MYSNFQARNFPPLGYQTSVEGNYGEERMKLKQSVRNDPHSDFISYPSKMGEISQADRSNRLSFQSDTRFHPIPKSFDPQPLQDFESMNDWAEVPEFNDEYMDQDEKDEDHEELELALTPDALQSSAPGKLKYKLMYIPSILAKRHLIRKLARFGKLSYFEFIPGEFSNKISPEVLLQSKTKFQDFKGAEFKFELEYSEKLFAGVKRLRVKGLQIKVIPPASAKIDIPHQENANSLNSGFGNEPAQPNNWSGYPNEFDLQYLRTPKEPAKPVKNHGNLVEYSPPEIELPGQPLIERSPPTEDFKIRPTQRAYYSLSGPDFSNRPDRSALQLRPDQRWSRHVQGKSRSGDDNYRLNVLDAKHLASFLIKYQQARKQRAVIMVKSAVLMQKSRN